MANKPSDIGTGHILVASVEFECQSDTLKWWAKVRKYEGSTLPSWYDEENSDCCEACGERGKVQRMTKWFPQENEGTSGDGKTPTEGQK